MKRLTALPNLLASILLISLVFEGFSASAQLKGDSFADAKTKGSANVIFTFVETPGFVAKEGAEVKGFCVDLMAEFGNWLQKEEGIVLKPILNDKNSKNFPLLMDELKSAGGGVFGLGTFTITEERKNSYAFSPPYINNITILLTNKNVPNLNSLEEISTGFSGMTMATVKGSLHERRLLKIKEDYFPQVEVKYVGSFNEVLQELVENEKAFTELDFTYYLASLKSRIPVKRHPVGDGTAEEFGIIMPKSTDWAPVMARFMNSGFMESTAYRKLIADHLGQHAVKLLDAVSIN
jgi:ABC-type amino acid transport substrate-binding protein